MSFPNDQSSLVRFEDLPVAAQSQFSAFSLALRFSIGCGTLPLPHPAMTDYWAAVPNRPAGRSRVPMKTPSLYATTWFPSVPFRNIYVNSRSASMFDSTVDSSSSFGYDFRTVYPLTPSASMEPACWHLVNGSGMTEQTIRMAAMAMFQRGWYLERSLMARTCAIYTLFNMGIVTTYDLRLCLELLITGAGHYLPLLAIYAIVTQANYKLYKAQSRTVMLDILRRLSQIYPDTTYCNRVLSKEVNLAGCTLDTIRRRLAVANRLGFELRITRKLEAQGNEGSSSTT